MRRLKQLLSLPEPDRRFITQPSTSDQRDAVRLLRIISVSGIVLTLLYAVIWIVVVQAFSTRIMTNAVPILLMLSCVYFLAWRGQAYLGSLMLIAGGWLLITIVVATAGGVRSPFFSMYVLVTLLTALLLNWRAAFRFGLLVITTGLMLALADLRGHIPPPLGEPVGAWVTQATTILLMVASSYFVVRRSNQALQAAQTELAERHQMQEALRASEERFRLISSVTSDYTFSSRFDAEGRMVHTLLSGAFETITGYTPEEFIARGGWRSTVHPDDLAQDERDMEALRRNERVTSEIRVLHRDGSVRWVRIYAQPVWDDAQNRLIGVNGGVQDITEQKQAAEALMISEKRHRAISELISDYAYAYEIQADGSIVCDWITHESFTRMTGYAWQEIGTSFSLYHPEDATRAEADVASTIAGQARSGEYRIITKGGEIRWLYLQRQVEWDEARQRYIRYYGAARDITEQKNAAEALRRSEAHLRALLDATTDVAFLMAADGTFLTLNKTMASSMSATVESLIGHNGLDLLRQDIRDQRRMRFEIVRKTREPLRWEDAGTIGWWDNSIFPILAPDGEVEAFAVYSRDISEQKRLTLELQRYTAQLEQMVEERTVQLRRAKEQIEIILENTRDGIALAQSNGDIDIRNPAFTDLFGEQIAQSIEQILWVLNVATDLEPVGQALLEALLEAQNQRLQTQIISEAGSVRDVDLALIPVRLQEDSNRHGLLVSAHDVTHLKEIERFKTRFVADAVHDMATPITALKTRLYLLRRSPERLEEHVRALDNQVEHLRDLLNDLRTLSQIDHGQIILKREPCSLLQILQRIYDTYEPVAISKRQTLHLSVDRALPDAVLDVRQIERALINLVTNAIKYTPEGRQIAIQAEVATDDALLIRVRDEGMGIRAEELPRIFDRFYRTEDVRGSEISGTGLGLAIAKEIFEMHGGSISVESQPNQGTTFTVWLPLHLTHA